MYSVKIALNNLNTFDLPGNFCVLDIETGGLSPRFSPLLLLGMAYIEDGSWVLESHLCEHRSEEPLLIHQWSLALHRFLLFFTYYGKNFDIPFLQERAKRHDLPVTLPKERHIDLFERGKLRSAEKSTGFQRTDLLSGKEWTELYRRYEKEQRFHQRHKLLLHNQDDLVGTIHLLLAREELKNSLPWRLSENMFLAETIPSPGNVRLLAIDRDNRLLCRDLPLLSFGRYHFLDIKESFDRMTPEEKHSILLLEGRNPQYNNICSLDKREDLRPFLIDKDWRQC